MERAERALAPSVGRGLYIPSLDGLRAIAVVTVFASHVWPQRFAVGGFGVTAFFFLSGYLITTLLRLEAERTGTVSLRHFYLRRALRIFPPMYLVLVGAAVVSAVVHHRLDGGTTGLQAAHLTNYHLALGGNDHARGTEVLWSLAVEEHFYLVFPLAYLGLRRLVARPAHQAAVLLGVCGLVLVWRCVLVLGLDVSSRYVMYATDTRLDSILFGCALALWHDPALAPRGAAARPVPPRWTPRQLGVAAAIGLAVLAATKLMVAPAVRETVRYSIQGLALAPIFIAAIQCAPRWPWRLLEHGAVRWIGVTSYGLYLVHLPLLEALRAAGITSTGTLAVAGFALSVAVAGALHVLVEEPCARLRRRLSRVQ